MASIEEVKTTPTDNETAAVGVGQEIPLLGEETNDDDKSDVISVLEKTVEDLYDFRDYYYAKNPIPSSGPTKKDAVEKKLKETIALLDSYEESALKQDRIVYYFLRARTLNVLYIGNSEAEQMLIKAIKLNPKFFKAWLELGEHYWESNNVKEAENCLQKALAIEKNKFSLRNMSVIERNRSYANRDEKLKFIENSIELAKEALTLDMEDGFSWLVLGTAYFQLYLWKYQAQVSQFANMALSAWTKAESDTKMKYSSDLYYNRGNLLKYRDEFENALKNYKQACDYNMGWTEPIEIYEGLLKYLSDITEFIVTYGKMKAKKLQQLQQAIQSNQLGMYQNTYVCRTGEKVILKEIPFSQLVPGVNTLKVVLGKVICSLHTNKVPFTFILMDKDRERVALEIFNLAVGHAIVIGDSIAIPEPTVLDVDFTHEEKHFKFRLIRVDLPFVLVVNGKNMKPEMMVPVNASVTQTFAT